jgi:serine protease Do
VTLRSGSAAPGLRLQPMQPRGAGPAERGLLVEGVSGRAARAGIRPGDILLAIGGQPADSVDSASAALGAQPVTMLVQRGQERRYFALPAAPAPLR